MRLSKEDSRLVTASFKRVTDMSLYIRPVLEIYQASEISRDKWLTDKEKAFYVATVAHVLLGYPNPICSESVQIYKKYFDSSTDKRKISDYLGRIRNKNWLKYDKFDKVVQLPPLFNQLGSSGGSIEFNIKFSYEPEA